MSKRTSLLARLLWAVLSFTATAVPALADQAAAPPCASEATADTSLAGRIVDASGARVAGAVIQVECGVVRRETTTGPDGSFALRVRPGRYVLRVIKPGFELVARDIVVGERDAPLEIALAVGPLAESVTVVSAAGAPHSLRDAPASVSVITSEDLARQPVRDLSDALATVEGITARRAGNSVAGVQVRGLDSAYTLMLIDGQRVNATSAVFRGNDFDTGWVPAEAIERVEVIRGPMSSLYGSDAIGGVVNIITRPVGQRWNGSAGVTGSVQSNRAAGDARTVNLSLTGPIVRDRLGVKLYGGYDHRDADGVVNPPQANGAQPLAGFPANDNRFVTGELAWVADAHHHVSARYDASRRDHGGFLLKRQAGAFVHRSQWRVGTSDVKVYGDVIRNLVGTVTGQVNPNRATKVAADGKLNIPAGRSLLTVGGEFRRETLDDPANLAGLPGTPDYGVPTTIAVAQSAAFAEADIDLGGALRVTLGNRFDHHEHFGGHNSPRAYVVYRLARTLTLKGGVARAFRAPTLLQNSPLWGSPSCGSVTTGCFIIGSLDLEPETSTSVEGGLQFDGGGWTAGVTLFRNDLENMIDITNRTNNADIAPTYPNFVGFLPAGPPGLGRAIFRYQNINTVRTQGVEATARTTVAAVTLRGNYGYLNAENLSGSTPLPLIYRPAHTVNVAADWLVTTALSLSGTVRATSAQYISVPATGLNLVERDAYGIVDLSAAYRVNAYVTLRGGVLNVAHNTLDRLLSTDFNEEGRRYFFTVSTRS